MLPDRGPSHEFALIDWIRGKAAAHPRVAVGIGDDAAVLQFPERSNCLVTVDMLMEGTDFLLDSATPRQIGRKSLGVNLSDIAAMAGTPLAAFVAVALPRREGETLASELYVGIDEMAREFDVALAGGDTNTWDGPLVISITVLGEAGPGGAVLRSGAKEGDWIFCTGSLGGSISGKHLDFIPRVREAIALRDAVPLQSMIDISDGLAADLFHILEESRVGAILDEAAIPVSPAASELQDGRSPLEHALGDGEDFELIFTVTPENGQRLLTKNPCAVSLTKLGEIVSGTGCQLRGRDDKLTPLPPLGWKHQFHNSR